MKTFTHIRSSWQTRRAIELEATMKLEWCPKTASKGYIDTVKALLGHRREDASVSELIAAMAAGWNAKLIVEACEDAEASTSIGLETAARHTGGRHVRVLVPDNWPERATECTQGGGEMEGGEVGKVMRWLEGVEFVVVDRLIGASEAVVRWARSGPRGMVVVCKNAGRDGIGLRMGERMRVVRSVFLPIGGGLEVLHVGVGHGGTSSGGSRPWVKYVDRRTSEEHVFWRR